MRDLPFSSVSAVHEARDRAVVFARQRGWTIPMFAADQVRAVLAEMGLASPSPEQLRAATQRADDLKRNPRFGGDKVTNAFTQALLAAACGYRSWEAMLPALQQMRLDDLFGRATMHMVMPDADDARAREFRDNLLSILHAPRMQWPYLLIAMVESANAGAATSHEVMITATPWVQAWAAVAADLLGLRMDFARPPESDIDKAKRMAETLADLSLSDAFWAYLAIAMNDGTGKMTQERGTVAMLAFPRMRDVLRIEAELASTVRPTLRRARVLDANAARDFLPLRAFHQRVLETGKLGRVGGTPSV